MIGVHICISSLLARVHGGRGSGRGSGSGRVRFGFLRPIDSISTDIAIATRAAPRAAFLRVTAAETFLFFLLTPYEYRSAHPT